ncbi:MAG: D-alanyl-D-alanine carboxypeptidase family protein [Candidatus Paceibacterota bacterium]
MKNSTQVCVLLTALFMVGAVVGWVLYYFAYLDIEDLGQNLAQASAEVEELNNIINNLEADKKQLSEELNNEKDRLDDLADQVAKATGTVGVLDKLSKTDEELLQKYSKVYFLNEHYVPPSLTDIDDEYVYREDKDEEIHSSVWPYLEDMLAEVKDDGVDLKVVSAYRSFGRQSELKTGYTVTYGAGANTFSADQGYSEHQLGTAVDFAAGREASAFVGFENTASYEWLQDNAYKYGFTLSYPLNNIYYQFEPWHWRFVGRDLARYLHRNDLNFYDVDQRKINEYLVDIFD